MKNDLKTDHLDFVKCYTNSTGGKVSVTKQGVNRELISVILNQSGHNETNLVTNQKKHFIKVVKNNSLMSAGTRGRYKKLRRAMM